MPNLTTGLGKLEAFKREWEREEEGNRVIEKRKYIYYGLSSGGRLLTCPISSEEGGRPCYL